MGKRAALFAAVLGMATSFGLVGTGVVSAAAPATLKIQPGSRWTAVSADAFCEVVTFHANGTFTSHNGPGGTWSGGGKTLSMTWPGTGPNPAATFSGTFTTVPFKEYVGTFDGAYDGAVEKGTGHGC
jgi:hypothetical protein